jgi:5'-methylthioadenosine phosphorylase
MVVKILKQNTQTAQEALRNLARSLQAARSCSCGDAMASALITDPTAVPPATRRKLDPLVRKYLK